MINKLTNICNIKNYKDIQLRGLICSSLRLKRLRDIEKIKC